MLKAPNGEDINLDTPEAFEIILSYAQKCINNKNNPNAIHGIMQGGTYKYESLANESQESLNKQYGLHGKCR